MENKKIKLAIQLTSGRYKSPKGFYRTSSQGAKNEELLADWILNNEIPVIKLQGRMNEEDFEKIKSIIKNGIGCAHVLSSYTSISNGHRKQVPLEQYYLESASGHRGDFDLSVIEIVDVDTSKLWFLDDNEGIESVRYFESGRNNELTEIR